MTVRPAAAARPRFSSLRRPIRSSSSRRRNSYSCSWKSSTDISLGSWCRSGDRTPSAGGSAIGSPRRGLAVESRTESGCARRSTRTSTNSDGELAPRARRAALRRARATTSSRSRTTGTAAMAPSTPGSSSFRASSSTACCPEDRDGHVLGIGIERDPTELEGERRDLAETADWIVGAGGVAYLAHPYWTGVRARRASSCPRPSRESRSSTRAASSRSAAASRRCTGTSCSRTAGLSRARDRRQPPSGLRLRPRVDVAARGADAGERARRAARRAGSTAAPAR